MSLTKQENQLTMLLDEHEGYYSTQQGEYYIEQIKKLNIIELQGVKIYYSDNIWDFSSNRKTNTDKADLRFNFNNIDINYKEVIKNYVLVNMKFGKNKIQSIKTYVKALIPFFNYLAENYVYSIDNVRAQDIENYIAEKEWAVNTESAFKSKLMGFYRYYSVNFKQVINEEIAELLKIDTVTVKAERKNSRIPNISKEYFNQLLSVLIKISDSQQEEERVKIIANIYLILSQTGLRIGEILSLQIDDIIQSNVSRANEISYLKYRTWKREKGNNVMSVVNIFANELTVKAFDNLVKLGEDERNRLKTNYLCVGLKSNMKLEDLPYTPKLFHHTATEFFSYLHKYIPTLDLPISSWAELKRMNVLNHVVIQRRYPGVATLTKPTTQQFRVYVCTELYNKGVPLDYIAKFLTHLSDDMKGYYVRPTKSNPQENIEFTRDTLKEIVSGNMTLLGSNAKSFTARLKVFVEENNYNVEKDLNTIVEKLTKQVPVRQKTGGVCIKGSLLRECAMDAKTNEFYCAYGVCPNIFHFYYMANISYRQFKELQETIEMNRKRNFLNQVQKETNMIKTIITKKLLPELDELNNVLNRQGKPYVIDKYPDLEKIVDNIQQIYEEAKAWI